MALPSQNVDLPFGKGLDEKTSGFHVEPPGLTSLSNGVFRKLGAVRVREGVRPMSSSPTFSTGTRLIDFDGESLALSVDSVQAHREQATQTWQDQGRIQRTQIADVIVGARGEIASNTTRTNCDCDAVMSATGLLITTWRGVAVGGGECIYAQAIDTVTGVRYPVFPVTGTTVGGGRVVVNATRAYLFYRTSNYVYARVLLLSAPESGWSAGLNLCNHGTPLAFDACSNGASAIYLAVALDEADSRLIQCGIDLTIVHDYVGAAGVYSTTISVCAGTTYVYTVYDDTESTDGIMCDCRNASDLSVRWNSYIDSDVYSGSASGVEGLGIACNASGSAACVVYGVVPRESVSPTRTFETRALTLTATNSTITGWSRTYHVLPRSRPCLLNSEWYATLALAWITDLGPSSGESPVYTYVNSQQYYAYIARLATSTLELSGAAQAVPEARVTWATAGSHDSDLLPGMSLYGNKFVVALAHKSDAQDRIPLATVLATSAVTQTDGFDVYLLDSAALSNHLPCRADASLLISGGTPQSYDRKRSAELGFSWYPVAVQSGADATGDLADGTYGFAFCYAWEDSCGVTHRSAPYFVAGVLVNVDHEAQKWWVQTQTLTAKHTSTDTTANPIRVEMYRTIDAGNTYYYVTSVANDPADVCVTIDDTTADATIIRNRQLYTGGGVLENIAPPALLHVCSHNGRLFGVSAEDPQEVWFSKQIVKAESPGWHETLVFRTPGLRNVALVSLQGKLVLLQERSIQVVFGSGPNDLGQGSDLSEPQEISSTVGCTDARSVVVTSLGVFFRAQQGLYLLDRGFSLRYVGAPVEDRVAAFPVLNGAHVDETVGEVRWLASETDASNTILLVYNFQLDAWSTWSIPTAMGAADAPFVDAAMLSRAGVPAMHLLSSTGVVSYQTLGAYLDPDGTAPKLTLKTAHYHLAGIQGFQRIRRVSLIGAHSSDSALKISAEYNYSGNALWGYDRAHADTMPVSIDGRVQWSIHVPTQKCQAIRFQIEMRPAFTAPAAPGSGITLEGLQLEVCAKKGASNRQLSSERKTRDAPTP